MKKKKILFGVFAALAAVSLTACNKSDDTTSTESVPAESSTVESSTVESTVAPVEEKKLVVFNTMGGSVIDSVELDETGVVAKPADSTKEGYAFAGWCADEACTTEFDFDATYSESTIAYAKWVKLMTYNEFQEANDGDQIAIAGYIAARQTYYNGAVLYIYAGEGAGYLGYNIGMTEDEYKNVYTVGKYVTIVGTRTSYAGEKEIASVGSIISVNPYVADSTDFVAVDVTDVSQYWKYENAYFKGTYTVKEYTPGKKEAASDDGSYGYNSSKVDSTTGLPYDDLYITLVDENGYEMNCCVERYLENSSAVKEVVMSADFAVGAKVEVTGFMYCYNGANPHITNITITEAAPTIYTAHFHVDANTCRDVEIKADEDGFFMVNRLDMTDTEYNTFGGWFADEACTEAFDFSNDISGDVDIYAKWNPIMESVTYSFKATQAYSGSEYTPTEDLQVGAFTIGTGCTVRAESGKSFSDVNYTCGVKLNGTSTFTFNAVGAGTAWLIAADRGSLKSVIVVDPDGNETKLSWAAGTINGDTDSTVSGTSKQCGKFAFAITKAGTYTVKLSEGTPDIVEASMTCEVGKAPKTGITVSGAQSEFLAGRAFSSSGLNIKLNYENGREDALLVDDVTIDSSAVDMNTAGTYTVTVTYGDFSASYDVNVFEIDSVTAYDHTVTSGTYITNNLTKVFLTGATFEAKNLAVHATGKCGELTKDFLLDASEYTVSTPDLTAVGAKEVLITSNNEKTTSYTINVVDNVISAAATAVTINVDKNGTVAATAEGITFTSIVDALTYLKACKVGSDVVKTLSIADGEYFEKVQISMPNVQLVGASGDAAKVTIVYDAYNGKTDPSGKSTYSTIGSATVFIEASATNFYAKDITFMNWYNTYERYAELKTITAGTQGDAVYCKADMAFFENCNFTGYQDTLEAEDGRQYYKNCYIEGHTDFIFGNTATAIFDNCEIHVIGMTEKAEKNNGYIFVTKGSGVKYGYIANNCRFTADAVVNAGSVSMGRTWSSSKTDMGMALIVMNSEIGAFVSKEAYGYETPQPAADSAEYASYIGNMNDRMTVMSAGSAYAIHPEQIVEYNNTGDGAISESLAGTCTVVTDASAYTDYLLVNTASDSYNADWREFVLTAFGAENGAITYNAAWSPLFDKDATVTLMNKDSAFETLTNVSYAGATVTKSQLDAVVLDNIPSGKKFEGYFADAELTTEYDFSTILTSTNTIYLKFVAAGATVDMAFSGVIADADSYAAWTVTAAAGTQKTSPTIGGNKDSADAVSIYKLGAGDSIVSPVFSAANSISITMLSASTGTGNPIGATVTLLDANGDAVKTYSWENVTTGKVTTSATCEIESDTDFVQFKVEFASPSGKNFGIYSINATAMLPVRTVEQNFSGVIADAESYAAWTVTAAAGTQKVSPTIGGNKDSADAVSVYKLGAGDSIVSPVFAAAKSISLTMLSCSTGTGNPIGATVTLLDANGEAVKTYSWESVTTGKVTTSATCEIESDTDFVQFKVEFASPSGKNFGIYSISSVITLK